jgi:hypothetical protein
MLKLSNCALPTNNTPTANLSICENSSATLLASTTGTINWYNVLTGGSSLGSGNSFTTPTLSAGTYTFYAEASDCTANESRTPVSVTVSICSGVNQINELQNILAYPNPVKETFTIQLNEKATLYVFDNLGRNVLQKDLDQGTNTINFKNYSSGIYHIKIQTNDKTKNLRLIKD